ncbi:Uncharacterised protein r2_g106 [Pycnogonum litorale]
MENVVLLSYRSCERIHTEVDSRPSTEPTVAENVCFGDNIWSGPIKKIYRQKSRKLNVSREFRDCKTVDRFCYSDDEDNKYFEADFQPSSEIFTKRQSANRNTKDGFVSNNKELRCKRKSPRRHKSLVARLPVVVEKIHRQMAKSRKNPRTFQVVCYLPDGSAKSLRGEKGILVYDLVNDVAVDHQIKNPRVWMTETGAEIDTEADAALLEHDSITLTDGDVMRDPRGDTDERFRIVDSIFETEKEYLRAIKTVPVMYAIPLRKLCSLSFDDHRLLFGWVEPITSISSMLLTKLQDVLSRWDAEDSCVGAIFSKQLWNQYEEYHKTYSKNITRLFRDKLDYDEEFMELCELRRGPAKLTLQHLLRLPVSYILLPVLAYDRYTDGPSIFLNFVDSSDME